MTSTANDLLLSTHDVAVGYRDGKRDIVLLSDINVTLRRGQMVALIGQNGAGKSTLLRALTCYTRPLAGHVELANVGVDLHSLSYRERSRLVGLVTTERVLAGALTVRELVELGRQPYTGQLGRLSAQDHEVVDEAIESVGIAHKRDAMIATLSDGERQKVMIAKALAQRTPLIVLDEPTAFLDVASRMEMMTLLHSLAHRQGKAVLLSSHDIAQSLLLADRLWVITGEREFLEGDTEQMVIDGTLERVFSSQALKFNPAIGDYDMVLPTTMGVALSCRDDAMTHAVTALLLRNGIAVNNRCTDVQVKVEALDRITLTTRHNETQQLSSLAALLNALKASQE